MAALQAGGVNHLGEQQGLRRPTPYQGAEDPVAHTRQRRLKHAAIELAGYAPARPAQWRGQHGFSSGKASMHSRYLPLSADLLRRILDDEFSDRFVCELVWQRLG